MTRKGLAQQIAEANKAEPERLRRGDVIRWQDGSVALIVKMGRGMARSAVIVRQTPKPGHPQQDLLLEIDYWHALGRIKLHSRKPANLRWAKEYCDRHPTPDV